MRFWNHTLTVATAAFAVIVNVGPVRATTLSFEQFKFNNSSASNPGHSSVLSIDELGNPSPTVLKKSGFVFTTNARQGFEVFSTDDERHTNPVSLFTDLGGTTTLTKEGGGTFSLLSIDVANLIYVGLEEITFIGVVHGGAMVKETFSLNFDSFGDLTTLTLNGDFRNLDSASWTQSDDRNDPEFQFTNVVVSSTDASGLSVPEPGTLALFGFASLVCLAAAKRRERNAELT